MHLTCRYAPMRKLCLAPGLVCIPHEAVPRQRPQSILVIAVVRAQVAVLGGQIGAMSKQGLGSTFWFTIPLLLPDAAPTRRPSGLRRTASWSCRDAFSDGHYDPSVGPRACLRCLMEAVACGYVPD